MAFDIASVLRSASAAASVESEPAQGDSIEYIKSDLIDADANNFYRLSGLEDLAASIEMIGIQQPLRVRASGNRYTIVSGHRRFAAAQMLDMATVPCIVERDECSPAMQELRLILANKDTRVLTAYEIGRQAERIHELFRQLQAEGVQFPGRMRDYVAEACGVSKSKLSRLAVIKAHLRHEFDLAYQSSDLSESAAYLIAQQDDKTQQRLYLSCGAYAKEADYAKALKSYSKPKKDLISALDGLINQPDPAGTADKKDKNHVVPESGTIPEAPIAEESTERTNKSSDRTNAPAIAAAPKDAVPESGTIPEPTAAKADVPELGTGWHTGTPPVTGTYYAEFACGDSRVRRPCWCEGDKVLSEKGGFAVGATLLRWHKVPEADE